MTDEEAGTIEIIPVLPIVIPVLFATLTPPRFPGDAVCKV